VAQSRRDGQTELSGIITVENGPTKQKPSSRVSVFLRAKAAMLSARLSYRNSVRPSVCHTGGSGKNGPS